MDTINSFIREMADDLILEYEGMEYKDALLIALQIERNQIFRDAFVVHKGINTPSGLEAIAMALRDF